MRPFRLLLILAAGSGLWLYTHPDAAPGLQALLPGTERPASERLFKWRDERGQWQVSDTLPPAGIAYETLEFHRNVNVLPVPPQIEASR